MYRVFIMLTAGILLAISAQAQSAFHMNGGLNLQAANSPAAASWVATEHDFGSIPEGTPVSHTFEVLNTGQQPFKITDVKTSCGCTVAEYTQEAIQPGEKGIVSATFSAKAPGMFNKSISVTTDIEEEPIIRLRLKGEVSGGN